MEGIVHIFLYFVSVFVCVRERQTEFLFATGVRQWSCLSQTFRVTKREHLVGGWLTGRGNNSEIMARQGWEGGASHPFEWRSRKFVACCLPTNHHQISQRRGAGRGGEGTYKREVTGATLYHEPYIMQHHLPTTENLSFEGGLPFSGQEVEMTKLAKKEKKQGCLFPGRYSNRATVLHVFKIYL